MEFRRLELPRRAKEADLQFVFDRAPDGGTEIAVTYNSEIFDAARVERLAGRLEETVQGLAENLPLIEILKTEPGSAAQSRARWCRRAVTTAWRHPCQSREPSGVAGDRASCRRTSA